MKTELTKNISQEVVLRAKAYAKKHDVYLSKIVEICLESITSEAQSQERATPLVKSISGVINLGKGYDFKSEYRAYLQKKYES